MVMLSVFALVLVAAWVLAVLGINGIGAHAYVVLAVAVLPLVAVLPFVVAMRSVRRGLA